MVKIEAVDTFLTHTYLLVRIRTESGIVGWGQTAYFSFPEAVETVVQRYAMYLVGKDATQIERHWYTMFRSSPFRSADRMGAISAIDIALWDIVGKHYESPIYQLLGGKQRDRIRLHYLMDGSSSNTLDEMVERAKFAQSEGFTALKIDPLPEGHQNLSESRLIEESVRRTEAVREAVGWDMDIGIEIHRKLVPGTAVSLATELAIFRPLFYEDAIQPDSMDAHTHVAQKVNIPIAIGERHHTIHEFRDLLANDSIHYVRPDVGAAGGITHTKKIATLAESCHAGVVLHNFLSPLLTAASAQVVTAIPNSTTLEYCMWDEGSPNGDLLSVGLNRQGGYLIPSESPGLGVEVNEAFIDEHPYKAGAPGAIVDLSGAVASH
jgi:galactonate dehydratase